MKIIQKLTFLVTNIFLFVLPDFIVLASNISVNDFSRQAQEITVLVDSNKGYGSGFLLSKDRDSYYVLTSSHVVENSNSIQLTTADRKVYQAALILQNLNNLDFAILKFDSTQIYQIATLANRSSSQSISLPELGNIYISGYEKQRNSRQLLLQCGFLLPDSFSLLFRQDPSSNGYELTYTNVTQDGLSGAPLLDNRGYVVGIHGRAEGEELEAIGSLNLGLSLGIPSGSIMNSLKAYSSQIPIQFDSDNSNLQPTLKADICEKEPVQSDSLYSALDWANFANSMLRVGKFTEALFAYDEAIKRNINGELYQLWYGRGLALIILDRPNEALENFDRALQLWGELPSDNAQNNRLKLAKSLILGYQGMLLELSGNHEQAIESYKEALNLNPENENILFSLAGALNNSNRRDEAIKIYSRIIQNSPESIVLLARANLYSEIGDFDLAIQDLNTAINLNPYDFSLYSMRAAMKKSSGDIRGAEDDYAHVEELIYNSFSFSNKGFDNGQLPRALSEFYSGNFDEGIDNLGDVIEEFGGEGMDDLVLDFFRTISDPDNLDSDNVENFSENLTNILLDFSMQLSQSNEGELDHDIYDLRRVTYPISVNFNSLIVNSEQRISYGELDSIIHRNLDKSEVYMAYAMRSAFKKNDNELKESQNDFDAALAVVDNPVDAYIFRAATYWSIGEIKDVLADLTQGAEVALELKDDENYRAIMSMRDRISTISN